VPLTTPDNWFSQFTTISVNNKWIKVQVDTGAYGMTMTQSLADAMVNNGDATRGEDSQVKGYDGVAQNVHHIIIKTLTFGGRDIANVDAVVVPDSGNPLLGMDILRQFGKFTIDTATSQLILG
jgi:clan AA aspartic protease (TIGR02281 family)